MVEPAEDTLTCATCGSTVSKSEWHPSRSFCSENCREEWGSPSVGNATV